jgi:hypothetical protein
MLKQPRRHSLVEAIANTVVGYLLAVLTQLAVFPQFGLEVPLAQSLMRGGVFTVLSLVRSYTLRRVFEAWRMRQV